MIRMTSLCMLALVSVTAACGSDDIDSDEEARRAYLGLDASIEKSLNLGFDGFNAASSANIAPQMGVGDLAGTLTITGKVDQGSSTNKGMRLQVGMLDYTDGLIVLEYEDEEIEVDLTYNTSEVETEQPFLDLKLMNYPNGTLNGTLTGTYSMTGDIESDATLNLSITGPTQDGGNGTVIRTPGATVITGTAVSGDGTYEINLTI